MITNLHSVASLIEKLSESYILQQLERDFPEAVYTEQYLHFQYLSYIQPHHIPQDRKDNDSVPFCPKHST